MRIIQHAMETGNAEKSDTQVYDCAGHSLGPVASCIDKIGMPSLRSPPKRWGPHRKAEVVAAVRGGFLTLDEACARYALSIVEYSTWQREIDLFGLEGLSLRRAQQRGEPGLDLQTSNRKTRSRFDVDATPNGK